MNTGRTLLRTATLAAGLITTAAVQAVTWTSYTFGPSDTLGNVQGMKAIMEQIEKETDGAVTFRLHLAGQLPIKATNITQAVGEGVIQFGEDGFFLGNVPIAGILRLPMLIHGEEEFLRAQEVMRPYIEEGFAEQGVVVLGHYVFPFQVAFANAPITSLADLEGMKMRVSSPEQAAFVEAFGGIGITLGGAEVPPALQRGTIDGVFTASAGGGKIWGDMLTHNYRIPVNYFNAVYVVNKGAFEALAPELQATIRSVVERMAPATTARIASEEEAITEKLRNAGMVVTHPEADEVARATERMQSYWDRWAEERGPKAQEALQKVRAVLGR